MNLIACYISGWDRPRAQWIALMTSLMLTSLALAQGEAPRVPAGAQSSVSPNISVRYPAGSIQSLEMADQALEEVSQARAGIEAQFAEDERACYPKFFTTACLQDAKERRRRSLARIRPIEVEANGYKRHARVVERDKALAERQTREESDAPQRSKEQQEKETDMLRKEMPDKAPQSYVSDEAESARRLEAAKRVADHEAKLKRRESEEFANAQKRAENMEAYEKKMHDAQMRQREIEAKKSEK